MTLLFALGAMLNAMPVTRIAPPDSPGASTATSATVLLNAAERDDVRRRKADFAPVLRKCGTETAYAPVPVALFGPDPHYNATGLNNSTNTPKQLQADSQAAYRAGLCYVVSGDRRFAATAQRILNAWSGTLTKVTTEQGKGDINFNMPYMIAAASWVRGAEGWDGVAFGNFLRSTVLPNSTSYNDNNHGMWGTLMESSAAGYLGDAALLAKARDRWTAILKGAASPDGTLIREIERSGTTNWRGGPDKGVKGMAYTHYFLLPASMAAKNFADQGRPVWADEGGKLLGAAFRKAAAWTLHPETFPFYAGNNGKLEGVRTVAYFPLLLKYYPSADAEAVLINGEVAAGGFLLPVLFRGARKG